jgi:hypothetical protein
MAKTAQTNETASSTFASFNDAFETIQSKVEVPAAARDFVKRTAASAKERAEGVQAGAIELTNTVEKYATAFVGGYANVARGLVDATFANVEHALVTVEKLAGAKSANEAIQLQADYARESARANFERARNAAETVRATVMDSAKTAQADFSKIYGQQAA